MAFLEVENLNKRFPHVWANQDVCFDVRAGEIHCLLGENGAGKSTLAECLYGAFQPDSGTIRFKGDVLMLSSPRDATRAGIGMVHQHFALAPALSVIENVVVGTSRELLLDLRSAEARIEALLAEYGVRLDLRIPVGELAIGQQQWVEILKALYVGAELLILDEPTAVLTPMEAQRLFDVLRRMKGEGLSVILITHKLDEVTEVSDRVTVLAKGRVVATMSTAEVSAPLLARMMVGRDVSLRVERRQNEPGDPVLEVIDLTVAGGSSDAVRGVSFQVRGREILGVVGISGNGQRELYEALVGVRLPRSGQIRLLGLDVSRCTARDLIDRQLSSVPEDRVRDGLVMDFRIDENLALGFHRQAPFSRWGLLRQSAMDEFAKNAVRTFGIASASPRGLTRALSGGNMQKVILARELSRSPMCLVVNQPTRGLDVGASEYVRNRLVDECARGAAIVLMSEDLDEVFDLADRIAVMFQGQFVGVLDPSTATMEEVGLLMGGVIGEPTP